jgi:hypothetical protein
MFHPSFLLDALAHAQISAAAAGEDSLELDLDYDALDAAADVGLAPDWHSTAIAQISPSGRIANIVLMHRSGEDSDSLLRIQCAISEPVEVGEIDLPPAQSTIPLAAKIEEGLDHPDS